MDMVWLDTMFPGIDEEEGWEENMKRVVNYDYLLKEYLDWQLKHLTTDNFDATDWANVTADIISMAAGSVDLTAYYDKSEVDAKAQLILDTADDHADAKLLSYYTKDDVDTAISGVEAYADEAVANLNISAYYTAAETDAAIQNTASQATLTAAANAASVAISAALGTLEDDQGNTLTVQQAISAASTLTLNTADSHTAASLQSYYTKSEIGDFTGYQTAVAALQAYADSAVANIDLTAAYNYTDGKIGNIGSYSTIKAYTDAQVANIDLTAAYNYTDGKIGNIGNYASIQAYADALISGLSLAATGSGSSAKLVLQSGGSTISGSGASITLGASSSNGSTTLTLSAGGTQLASKSVSINADSIKTNATITAPQIVSNSTYTTKITSAEIYASTIYATSGNTNNYCYMQADGFTVVTNGYTRARLYQGSDFVALRLGDSDFAYVEKYQSGGTDYMWIGGGTRGQGGVGIRFDLDNKTYKIFGTAE